MRHIATAALAAMFFLSSIPAKAVLPENWHEIYPPGDGWRIVCDVTGTNGSMIYFKPSAAEPQASDILVRIIYSHNLCWLYIAPYDGQCLGGTVSIDGKPRFDLVGEGDYCVSACGRNFLTPEKDRNNKKQSIAMFAEGKELVITMNTEDGPPISATIPLTGFAEVYSQLEAGTNCGVSIQPKLP